MSFFCMYWKCLFFLHTKMIILLVMNSRYKLFSLKMWLLLLVSSVPIVVEETSTNSQMFIHLRKLFFSLWSYLRFFSFSLEFRGCMRYFHLFIHLTKFSWTSNTKVQVIQLWPKQMRMLFSHLLLFCLFSYLEFCWVLNSQKWVNYCFLNFI